MRLPLLAPRPRVVQTYRGMLGFVAIIGIVMIALVLLDAFEAILQPRRVTRRYRFARLYYHFTWLGWRGVAVLFPLRRRRESFLSVFGPASLIGLFISWIAALIIGFAFVHWSLRTPLLLTAGGPATFASYLYLSGSTFFTLGYGDVTAASTFGHALTVIESGLGFGFLAILISYLPVLYQAFSQREITISLLDARAGSPPSASQVLKRAARSGSIASINSFLAEWERWSAELLEGHLSFPVLSYYRSQHDNQSWLATLTMILDTCAIVLSQIKSLNRHQAQLTFAIARHAAVDMALVLKTPPEAPDPDRLSPEKLERLRQMLRDAGYELQDDPNRRPIADLRAMYEPFVYAMSNHFQYAMPHFVTEDGEADNWQRSAWMRRAPDINKLSAVVDEQHFE